MSLELFNDDEIDISDLADLVSNILTSTTSDGKRGRDMPKALDARRTVERHLDRKKLQAQIQDPLYGC